MPRRALVLVAFVCAGGAAALGLAAASAVERGYGWGEAAGVSALFLLVAFAERFPVPVEGIGSGGVTLGFVFAVAAIVLYGWQAGVLVAGAGPVLGQLGTRRPSHRVAYNGAMFALSALAGGIAVSAIHGGSAAALLGRVALCGFLYNWVVNVTLLSAVVALDTGRSAVALARRNMAQTSAPFALMTSASLMLVVLWQRSPVLSAALVGPLAAIALYQRSAVEALRAMRLALTDPLTGLGNQRHFNEQLRRALAHTEEGGGHVGLVLVDVDDFKTINDRHGHPAGDRLLGQLASRLRQGGEAFRLGGDEFAVLLPGHDEQAALAVASAIVERVAAARFDLPETATVSAGVATYPSQGVGRDELIRLADGALYRAKDEGKNCARLHAPSLREQSGLGKLAELGELSDRRARYRAAASLARAVDARDAYTGRHSERVGELAARIARRLGGDDADVELTRLAGSLHDVGKLGIPEEILRKPGELDDEERQVLERHPRIGYRMLESLGVEPVAACVLHHHERWDGSGYPDRLRAEEIPLGARIIFVADAYDAMTSQRIYRPRLSEQEAFAELTRCAGSQFDPAIVDAFSVELGFELAVPA